MVKKKTASVKRGITSVKVKKIPKTSKRVTATSSKTAQKSASKTPLRYVDLRINKVVCFKTTKEIDRDEIIIAGIKTQGKVESKNGKKKVVGKTEKGRTISVGKFKKGTVKQYKKPRIAARFNLGGKNLKGPRYFYAGLLMIEKDEGAIGTIVNMTINKVDKALIKAITNTVSQAATTALTTTLASAGITGAAVGSVVPLVGTAIGTAAGIAVSKGLTEIKKSRADDKFPLKKIVLKLSEYPSKKGVINKSVINYKAHKSHYRVVYSWKIS